MRIAIMGSGGVGAYVGARLQAAREDVVFIARGAHLQALQHSGLRIEYPRACPSPGARHGHRRPLQHRPVDLVIFAVKLWDTEAAARAMAPLVGPQTRIVTLQNGIDSVGLISGALPGARVLGGVIYVSAVIESPGIIRSPGGMHRIVVDAAGGDPVIAAFCAACERATALRCHGHRCHGVAIWEKFVTLAAVAGATSLLRARMGQIMGHPETRIFQRQLIDEGVAVGRAAGQALRADLADDVMSRLTALPGSFRSSMSEDLERGKPLELQWLSGRVHGLGLQHDVPTPAHSAVYRALVLYEHGKAVV